MSQIHRELPVMRAAADSSVMAVAKALTELEQRGPVPSMNMVSTELRRCREEAMTHEKRIKDIGEQLQQLAQRIVQEAKVIGATLTKLSTTQELYQNSFDNLIVDEASMVPQPHLWFASALSTKRVFILGDFRQLQPICIAHESPIAQKRIAKSIYQESGLIGDDQNVRLDDPRLVSLRKQYRMHEQIGELANELVYRNDRNPLEHCAPSSRTESGTGVNPQPGSPLVLCDTSSANPWCARLEPGYSRYNIYSAVTAIRLAKQAVRSVGARSVEVGIICPYAAQARLLQMLALEHGLTDAVKVATVHRFQGNEKDVIIVDLVDGPPFARPGVLLTQDEAKNLLNVAFSRAKGKLVLISHSEYMERGQSIGHALSTTHAYFGKHAHVVDSTSVLVGYGDPEVSRSTGILAGGISLGNPEGMSLYHEGTFYPAFMKDLQLAQRQVVIFSPFIQPGRSALLIPVLRGLLERGVQVLIITRPKERPTQTVEGSGGGRAEHGAIDELERLGVKTAFRQRLHEKLAFIDDKVTWMGSLNILSQSQTTEQMVRFDNAQLTAMFLEFNGISALLRREKREEKRSTRLDLIRTALEKRMATPRCPQCGQPMVLRVSKFGAFFGCRKYPADKETVAVPRAALASIIEEMDIPCSACDEGRMRLRSTAKGVFLGCSKYPECRSTEPLG